MSLIVPQAPVAHTDGSASRPSFAPSSHRRTSRFARSSSVAILRSCLPPRHLVAVGRHGATQAALLKLHFMLAAEHNVNLMPLVPQIGIAGNHGHVFRVRRRSEARSNFTHH